MNRPGTAARELAFPDLGDLAYLDTASTGVLPAEAAAALRDVTAVWAGGRADYGEWEAAAEEARGLAARLVGMAAHDVALLPSHVAAATTVARAWPDARVVVPEAEFRANLLPWIADRDRGAVRLVPSPATTEALCAAVDEGADLVAVSSVQSADGLRVDLARLVDHAHRRGTIVYVDASQSLGVDATLNRCGADFIGAVGYKWLLGARGTAFLAVRPEYQRRFGPVLTGPESAADGEVYGAEYRLWDDARRFDQPQAWQAWAATAASLRHLISYDQVELERHATGLAGRFIAAVQALGVATAPTDVPSPIVAVSHPDPEATVQRLRDAGVRAAARAGSIRFAFHLYNTDHDVDRAIAAIAASNGSTTT
jgi:selenocysteine lyase/cysteine desulfurase